MTIQRILLNLRPDRVLSTLVILSIGLLGWGESDAQTRFSYSTDGAEVTDTQTRLVWQRCSQGQNWSGVTCSGTANTYNHEQALALAKAQAGWRLPNVKELSSLVDTNRTSPSIDPIAFPGTPSDGFWSSTPSSISTTWAWPVNFIDGGVRTNYRYWPYYVRLVR